MAGNLIAKREGEKKNCCPFFYFFEVTEIKRKQERCLGSREENFQFSKEARLPLSKGPPERSKGKEKIEVGVWQPEALILGFLGIPLDPLGL